MRDFLKENHSKINFDKNSDLESLVEFFSQKIRALFAYETSNKIPRGRKPTFDEIAAWKVFVESLDGNLDESKSDFAQQAYDAYYKLDDGKKKELAFVHKESITKQNIIAYLLEKTEGKNGGKTTLDDRIATPFAEKFPEFPRR